MPILDHVISAASGLVGAIIGAWAALAAQKRARRRERQAAQLNVFYAPLFGMRAQVLAKSLVRVRVESASDDAWRSLAERERTLGARDCEEAWEHFAPTSDHDNRQLAEELIPLYRKMVKYFAKNIGYAEATTLRHFPELVEFVEIWERRLSKTIPSEVVRCLRHDETKLWPFYRELATQVERLQAELLDPGLLTRTWRRPTDRGKDIKRLVLPPEASGDTEPRRPGTGG